MAAHVSSSSSVSSTLFHTKKNKKDRKKLTKADIGLPSNFTHRSHVGWDANRGFALENVDTNLMQFFAKVNRRSVALQKT